MRTMLFAALLTLAASAALADTKSPAKKGPDWKISGWEVTTCCCKDLCPCRVNEKPTYMECESTISVHIDKGNFGATKLTDVNFILVGQGLTFNESKGWNKIYFDTDVSKEEQEAVLGILGSMISSYDPAVAAKVFGAENRGAEVVPMTFTKSHNGLVREIDAPGLVKVRARVGKVPTSKKPVHILGVLTEFSPIFHPAAEVMAMVDKGKVPFEHASHGRAEVEDFVLTRKDYETRKIGFQAYTGSGGCLLPKK